MRLMLIQYKVLWPAFGLHISARTPFKPLSVFLPLFGRLSQAYERLQTALVDAVVVLRAVNLYHEVSQKSSPLYPSCMIIMYMCQGQGSHEFMHRGGMHKQTNMHTHTLSLSPSFTLSHKQALSLFPGFGDFFEGTLFALHEAVEEVPFSRMRGAVVCMLAGFPVRTNPGSNSKQTCMCVHAHWYIHVHAHMSRACCVQASRTPTAGAGLPGGCFGVSG